MARTRDALLATLAVVLLALGAGVLLTGGHLSAGAVTPDADGGRAPALASEHAVVTDDGVAAPDRPPGPDAAAVHEETLERFAEAQASALADGVHMWVTSGLRSAEEQQAIVDDTLAERGPVEGRRWALPPERSAHVAGTALDVGGDGAADWLAAHGSDFGFCHVYANEPWHVELLVEPGDGCPHLKPDASVDWP